MLSSRLSEEMNDVFKEYCLGLTSKQTIFVKILVDKLGGLESLNCSTMDKFGNSEGICQDMRTNCNRIRHQTDPSFLVCHFCCNFFPIYERVHVLEVPKCTKFKEQAIQYRFDGYLAAFCFNNT